VLFERVFHDIAYGGDGMSLSKSMNASERLIFERWVPLGFEKMDRRCRCQVQTTGATSNGDQNDAYTGVSLKPFTARLRFFGWTLPSIRTDRMT